MNRLTKDLDTPHDDTTYSDIVKDAVDREQIVLTRLKHYENLEEEIGFDVILLFRALINGIYHFVYSPFENHAIRYVESNRVCIDSDRIYILRHSEISEDYSFKEYGKKWALTKEELQNEETYNHNA